ncbi:MAG: YgiT-type zinc finger protein [Chloroflexi bacterium]|nr:YgiT-type zinc finger protein [Chloroflexota bacterium]
MGSEQWEVRGGGWDERKTCYFCKGSVIEKRVRHVHYWRDKIVVFENVPAEVCQQCGEVYFALEVLDMMDKATLDKTKPDGTLTVPVFALP